jgi:5-formyltetrahydrofolate cyclo-ligase
MTSSPSIACDTSQLPQEIAVGIDLDKAVLRRSLIAARGALGDRQRAEWDAALCARLLAWWTAHPVESLAVYWPIRDEPDLRPVFAELAAHGVRLALPVVTGKTAPLAFAAWVPGDVLIKDRYGVSIPASAEFVPCPQALLIPCVGFNAACFRLGYGGGFYDRTLAVTPRPLTVGIAYSCLAADFEVAPHDIALDVILTESAALGLSA